MSGSALLVAGGVTSAWGLNENPNILHTLGLSSSPDKHVPPSATNVHSGSFDSVHMHKSVVYSYTVPETQPVATVFALHGRGSNHTNTFDELRLHDFVAAAKLPLAIAAVDGGDHSYWHARDDGTNAMRMLVEEFVPLIEKHTHTDRRGVFGWSMGGYGAILASVMNPELFGATAALSPALWTKASDSADGAFDNADDFNRNDVFMLSKTQPLKHL